MKKLLRSRTDSKISGICGGLGVYFGIDSNIIRVIVIVIMIFTAILPTIIGYIILTYVIPLESNILE